MSLALDTPELPKKTIARPSRQSFRLTLDADTQQELVMLQREFTSLTMIPSRTVLCRLALRRLSAEVRVQRADEQWTEDRLRDLQFLAHAGVK